MASHAPNARYTAVRHDRLLYTAIDLLLGPIRRSHEPGEPRERQEQTPEAYPPGANLHTYQMERQDQAMEESKTGDPVKKRHDRGAFIKVLWVR
jgi:hypothetical protein